ncbi:MAG: hypothetical protein H6825_03015 [Planctomycetes bacterium]|nr:hypothetical protein [Planctomycetota bacterium]
MGTDIERLARVEAKVGELRVANAKLQRDLRDLTLGVFGCFACLSLVPGGVAVVAWLSFIGIAIGIVRFARSRPRPSHASAGAAAAPTDGGSRGH